MGGLEKYGGGLKSFFRVVLGGGQGYLGVCMGRGGQKLIFSNLKGGKISTKSKVFLQ